MDEARVVRRGVARVAVPHVERHGAHARQVAGGPSVCGVDTARSYVSISDDVARADRRGSRRAVLPAARGGGGAGVIRRYAIWLCAGVSAQGAR
jgi:hypothetical protein